MAYQPFGGELITKHVLDNKSDSFIFQGPTIIYYVSGERDGFKSFLRLFTCKWM